MADLSFILDRALSLAAVAAPMVILVALACLVAARTWADPARPCSEEEPATRWRLDR